MYDVGGTRSSVGCRHPHMVTSKTNCSWQRAHWYPYFDDMDGIIFLAPISSFNERLREDRRVNRLEDTYMLWQTLCSLQMLSKTQIILFLNKCDLLEQKLRAGVKVRTYVPSFGDRSNDVDTVKKCECSLLRAHVLGLGLTKGLPQTFNLTSKRLRDNIRLNSVGTTYT